jgi:hypothetical protein
MGRSTHMFNDIKEMLIIFTVFDYSYSAEYQNDLLSLSFGVVLYSSKVISY